jgi:hypothetical protein
MAHVERRTLKNGTAAWRVRCDGRDGLEPVFSGTGL